MSENLDYVMKVDACRRYLCREHGMCSVRDCNQPIIGWEEQGWGRKLCEYHLSGSEGIGIETYRPEKWAQDVIEAKKLFDLE